LVRTKLASGDTHTIWVGETLYGTPSPDVKPFINSLMSSSLEDRIHLLTDQAVAAKTQREVDAILHELNAAISDHVRYLRVIAVEMIPEAFRTESKAAD